MHRAAVSASEATVACPEAKPETYASGQWIDIGA